MLICLDHRVGIIVIPKAASSTMMNAVRMTGLRWGEVSAKDFGELPQRMCMMRQPHARLESAYRMYCKTGQRYDSLEAFVDNVCSGDKQDVHIRPQARLMAPKGVFLPNYIIRWDFDELGQFLGLPNLPHENKGSPAPCEWTRAAREQFAEHYAADLELWNGR